VATFQPNPNDALASKAGIGTHPAKRAWHELAEAARARINGQLGAGVASAMVCAAIDALIALGEADAALGDSRTACSKGCSYCCHMRVVLTAPEVLRIAAFVEETFSVDECVALARRVAATDEETRGLSDEAWGRARLPCPLLVGDECSVYPVRPLDCRAYNSRSVAACRNAFESYADWEVPVDSEHQSFYKSVQAGLLQALAGSGRPASLLELTAALRVILEGPDAILHWCAGENVFAAAELPPDDAEQQAFLPWTPSDFLRRDGTDQPP
jgi:Fe-S-cluster containining protein